MTAIVVVNVVLPGLVPLLMHKTESVRIRVVNLVGYLANFVGTAKDTKSWPDGATATSTPLIGSTRRKNLFLGSLVEVHAAQQKKNGETGETEDDNDDEDDKSWSSWKSEQVPTVSGPRAQLFDGLELKKSPVSSRASEAPRKKDLAGREARSKSQETVMLPEKKSPEPEQVQSKPEPAVFVVPSPRGVRAEVPAKPPVVLPRPVSPPNPRV